MGIVDAGRSGKPELRELLVAAVRRELATTSTPGVTAALLLDGQAVWVSGVGFSDLGQTSRLHAQAQFYIYSVTKTALAAVILQLVEQGDLALDTPIQTYISPLPFDTAVTIRQLLNHTAGLPDYGALRAYGADLRADPARPWTDDEFLARTLAQGFVFAPGQGWAYSNIGYLLLRRLIEELTHTPLSTALHQRIFAPLDLRHTFVAQTLADAGQLTPGYSALFSSDGSLRDIRLLYHPGWVSHATVVSTAPELARLIDAVFTAQLLDPGSLAAMLEPVPVPHTHPLFQQPSYGLGLMIDRGARCGVLVGHGGGGPGYSAGALHLPDVHGRRITSVALANRDQPDLGLRVAFRVAALLADAVTG